MRIAISTDMSWSPNFANGAIDEIEEVRDDKQLLPETFSSYKTGEHRALCCLIQNLTKLGHEVVIISETHPTDSSGIFVFPRESDFSADALLLHINPAQYINQGYHKHYESLLQRCSGNVIFFNWNRDDVIDYRDMKDYANPFLVLYDDNQHISDANYDDIPIPMCRWSSFIPEWFSWVPEIPNVLVYTPNRHGEKLSGLKDLLCAFEKLLYVYPDLNLDICRSTGLLFEDFHKDGRLNVDVAELLNTPNLRLLPPYPYNRWLSYVSRSSIFLVTCYDRTGQGVLEPPFLGVPSIMARHTFVPEDYPLIGEDKGEEWLFKHLKLVFDWIYTGEPVWIGNAVKDLQGFLKRYYSEQASLKSTKNMVLQMSEAFNVAA